MTRRRIDVRPRGLFTLAAPSVTFEVNISADGLAPRSDRQENTQKNPVVNYAHSRYRRTDVAARE
jgi:hypothetical protein